MSTLSKESTGAPSSTTAESQAPQTSKQPQSSSSQLHSDAVSLEVALKVHGSKVTEVVRGVTPHTEPFEEETSSMIVFPHGGVLRMSTSVSAGQMLVLTNLKSRQDAICRVVKVRTYSSSSSYVEVEFTHRQPGFWGVYFESDSLAAATPAATPVPSSESPAKSSKGTGPSVSAPKNSGLDKSGSTFIAIGSQEDVQPAASSTSAISSSERVRTTADSNAFQKAVVVTQSSSSVHPVSSRAPQSQLEEEDTSVETLGEPSNAAASPASTSKASRSLASEGEDFGSRLDSPGQAEQASEGTKNWLLVAACVAALLVAAGGALFLSHHKSGGVPAARVQIPAAPAPSQAVQVAPSPVTLKPAASRPNVAPPLAAARTAPAIPAKSPRDAAVVAESSAEPAPTPAATGKRAVPSIFGALNSHPVSSRQRADGIAAPNLDAVPSPGGDALAGLTSSASPSAPSFSAPPPSANLRVSAPVQSSSGPRLPRLLVRVIPQYPPIARQTHTEGDVVLQIAVDKTGAVTDAKVLSGPTVLRMAAIGAVRRWKYEPLDEALNSAKMTVTIQFRL